MNSGEDLSTVKKPKQRALNWWTTPARQTKDMVIILDSLEFDRSHPLGLPGISHPPSEGGQD